MAPARLFLVFSEPDGLRASPSWHGSLLDLIRVLTRVVLTGEGAYLARRARRRGAKCSSDTAVSS